MRVGEVEDGVEPTDRPVLATRPPLEESLASVISLPTDCEPRDIVQNRLDPWHGAWLHPYAFSDLTVDDDASTDDLLVLDVAYRLGRYFAVPVRAEFSLPRLAHHRHDDHRRRGHRQRRRDPRHPAHRARQRTRRAR